MTSMLRPHLSRPLGSHFRWTPNASASHTRMSVPLAFTTELPVSFSLAARIPVLMGIAPIANLQAPTGLHEGRDSAAHPHTPVEATI